MFPVAVFGIERTRLMTFCGIPILRRSRANRCRWGRTGGSRTKSPG